MTLLPQPPNSTLLPKSRVIQVTFLFALPVSATLAEIDEWVEFELKHYGGLEGENPLAEFDLEAISSPILTDTAKHIHESVEQTGENRFTTRRSLRPEPCWGPTGNEQMTAIALAKYKDAKP